MAADLGKDQADVYSTAQTASQNHDYTSDLSSQNAGQTSDLSAQNAGQTQDLTKLQGSIASDLSAQNSSQTADIAKLTASLSAANQEKQNEFTKTLAELGYDEQKTQQLASIISNQSTAFMNNVAGLLNNTEIEMGDNVTKWLTDAMYASWETSASLLKQDIQVI